METTWASGAIELLRHADSHINLESGAGAGAKGGDQQQKKTKGGDHHQNQKVGTGIANFKAMPVPDSSDSYVSRTSTYDIELGGAV